MPRPVPYVIIRCPRCKKRSLKITKHQCNRFVCGGSSSTCDAYDGHCLNCDYPYPKGTRAYTEKYSGTVIWERGKFANPEAERIFSQEVERLPPPFDGTIPLGGNGWWS